MFEKEIQTAKQQLSSHLLTGETYVYLHEVLSKPEVHDFYKTFFSSEVDWWIYEQRMLREVNPRFDFADEQFGAVLHQFDNHCHRTARFDHAELTSLIDLAVKTRINYLLRPRTTLKWFVYRGEPTKPLREVLLRLAYFDCYRYLTDAFVQWAHSKLNESSQQDILSVIEFERLIENTDNDIILEHTTSEFTQLLTPLYDFFNEVQPDTRRDVIPTPALIIFLDDKGILRISQELERLMKETDLDVISRDQFLRVIDDVITQVEEEVPPEYMDVTTIPLDFDRSARKAEPAQQENNEAADRDRQPVDQPEAATTHEETIVDKPAPEDSDEAAEDEQQPVKQQEQEVPVTAGESDAVQEAKIQQDGGDAPQEEITEEPAADPEQSSAIPSFSLAPTFFRERADETENEDAAAVDPDPAFDRIDIVPPEEAGGLSRALADLSIAASALHPEPVEQEPAGDVPSADNSVVVPEEIETPAQPADSPAASMPADVYGAAKQDADSGTAANILDEAEFVIDEIEEAVDVPEDIHGGEAVALPDVVLLQDDFTEEFTEEVVAGEILVDNIDEEPPTQVDPAAFYVPEEQPDLSVDETGPTIAEGIPEPDIIFLSGEEAASQAEETVASSAEYDSTRQDTIEAEPEHTVVSPAPAPSLKRIEELLDDSLRQRVLKHVFHKNEGRFHSVMERLNATHSWRDASAIIDRVFSEHEVDPYSSIAKKFSDIVYERFSAG